MLGKGQAVSHTKASIQYGWNQEKDAEIVFKQNLAGETPTEITEEFKIIQSMNEKCEKNTLSFIISPTIEDGKKLDNLGLNKIADEFIKDMRLENHQAIAFVHNDKKHKHIHLYVNRIDFKGKAYNDSYISNHSYKSAERVAEKLHLKTIKQVQQEKLNRLKHIRKEIHNKHLKCIQINNPHSIQNYIDLMKKENIKVQPVINKQNKLQGFRYHYKGTNLKGSEVHRSMSINKLVPQINLKKEYAKNNGIQLANKIVHLPTNLATSIMKSLVKNVVKQITRY
jgi:hypothetical protein